MSEQQLVTVIVLGYVAALILVGIATSLWYDWRHKKGP